MLEVIYLDHSTSAGCGVTSTEMHFNILPFVFLILRKHEKKIHQLLTVYAVRILLSVL